MTITIITMKTITIITIISFTTMLIIGSLRNHDDDGKKNPTNLHI